MYVVKMDGMKVRSFDNLLVANAWAKKHCRSGNIEIVKLTDCGRLPGASSRRYPNEDLGSLVYRPFQNVNA